MNWFRSISLQLKAALILGAAGLLLLLAVIHLWRHDRTEAAERRVESAQSQAAVASGRDAVDTQAAASVREGASDALTQSNERKINDAEGASEPVKAPARDAGIAALCLRDAYRDSERCRMLRADPR